MTITLDIPEELFNRCAHHSVRSTTPLHEWVLQAITLAVIRADENEEE